MLCKQKKIFKGNTFSGKPFLGPILDGSPHWELWKVLENELPYWRFEDANGKKVTTPTVDNILRNIRCYKIIWETLRDEGGYQEFFLGEVNQDPLENGFGVFKFFASLMSTPTNVEIVTGKLR